MKDKSAFYRKPGDLLIRLKNGLDRDFGYFNPYIMQSLELGDGLLTRGDFCTRKDEVFNKNPPLIIEIGCYKGTTLTALALHNPHCRFLGIDIKYKRVVLTHRKISQAGLGDTVFIGIIDAIGLFELVPPDSIQGVCLFYPDPWEKERYLQRRIVSPFFIGQLHKALQSGGFLWLKTDHSEYLEQMREVLKEFEFIHSATPPAPLTAGPYPTDFENLFANLKRPTFEICVIKPFT